MNINVTYPELSKKRATREKLIRILRLPFAICAIACPIVNFAVGGPAWAIIALFGLYMIWNLAVAVDLIEYNRISQFIKLITYSIIMLALINYILAPGWAEFVLPIVGFSCLVVAAVLFFTDFERQRHNLMPLLVVDLLALLAAIGVIAYYYNNESFTRWPYIVLGGVALTLLVTLIFTLKGGFFAELKRRLHSKIS